MGQRVNSHFVHITRLFLIYLRVSSCWCIQPRRRSVVASKRISCAFVIAQSRFFFIPEGKTSCHWDISSSGRVRSANCKKILFCILRLKDVWIGRQHTVLACTSDCLSLPRIYAYLYKKSAEEKVWFTFSVGVFPAITNKRPSISRRSWSWEVWRVINACRTESNPACFKPTNSNATICATGFFSLGPPTKTLLILGYAETLEYPGMEMWLTWNMRVASYRGDTWGS